jgi:hypothetical protein
MAGDDVEYDFKSVKAIRSMEARTIAKWESQGWELEAQTPGTVRTDLVFRRVKPKASKRGVLVAISGLIAVAVIGLSIGTIADGNDDDSKSTAPPPVTPTPSESASTTDETTAVPTPSESAPAGPLTAANSPDVAALLRMDYCDQRIGVFAAKYEGQSIQFDGVITNMVPHGGAKTRYDILISPGNKVDATAGPAFKYEDVNTVSDLGWTGSDTPDSVGVASKLRFTADVGEYNSDQCIFFLEPISTETR